VPPKKVIPETPAERTSPLSAELEGREADPVIIEGSIDERMKALLKDHQEMGARPKRDPSNGDLYDNSYPLAEVGTKNGKTVIDKKK
jgi:hypothetical protein